MKKEIVKQFLTLLLVLLLLTGCVAAPAETTGSPETTSPASTQATLQTKPEPEIARQVLPETVDNPENLPVLKWVCMNDIYGGGARVWTEDAVVELNQMLADRNMPFRIQMIMYTGTVFDFPYGNEFFAHSATQNDLQTADLIYGYMTGDDARKLLIPITDHATGKAEPSLKSAVPHDLYWNETTLDGEVYGVPTLKDYPTGLGWFVDKTFMQEKELSDADFQKPFWEMDDVFAKIFEKNGKVGFLYANTASVSYFTNPTTGVPIDDCAPSLISFILWQKFAGCGSVFGIDMETQKVVNILDTDFARNMQQAYMRYTKAGYISKSGKYSISLGNVYGNLPCDLSTGKRIIPITQAYYNASARYAPSRMNGVAKNSKYQQEALTLLKLLADDEEFMMQLAYGKEGRDYTIDEEGYYHAVKRDDGAYYYMSHLAIMSGFTDIRIKDGGNSLANPGASTSKDVVYEGMTRLEAHREMWNNAEKKYFVAFDYTGFEAELAAIAKVCKTYFSSYSMMASEKYDKMIADFNAAGADRILASLQKQYDQWKKDNPDKAG